VWNEYTVGRAFGLAPFAAWADYNFP
jgi:hypothetical protein